MSDTTSNPWDAQKTAKHPLLDDNVTGCRKNIAATDEVRTLKSMLASEQAQPKPRSTVVSALEERIEVLTKAEAKADPIEEKQLAAKAEIKDPRADEPVTDGAPTKPTAVFVTVDERVTVEFDSVPAMLKVVKRVIQEMSSPQGASVIPMDDGHLFLMGIKHIRTYGCEKVVITNVRRMLDRLN